MTKLKDIDVFKPESLWDTARLAMGLTAIGSLLVDQVRAVNEITYNSIGLYCWMLFHGINVKR